MLLKQQMLESLHDESWKLPVAYIFLSGSRTGHSGTGRKPGLKISIVSEHLSLSVLPMGYAGLKLALRVTGHCTPETGAETLYGWMLNALRAFPVRLKPHCGHTLVDLPACRVNRCWF